MSEVIFPGKTGEGGYYAQIVPLKITIVVPNDSLVIFWTVFTSVPTTFDLHCSTITCPNNERQFFQGKFFLC